MVGFISRMIENAAKKSIEQGRAKYRAYFIKTDNYLEWKEEVDTILVTDGYEDVIVEK